jgi:hypothetical protein
VWVQTVAGRAKVSAMARMRMMELMVRLLDGYGSCSVWKLQQKFLESPTYQQNDYNYGDVPIDAISGASLRSEAPNTCGYAAAYQTLGAPAPPTAPSAAE